MNSKIYVKFTSYLTWYVIFCVVLALVIPSNIREIAPFVGDFVEQVSSTFPAIGSWAKKSEGLEDVVALFMIVQWLLLPALIYIQTTRVVMIEPKKGVTWGVRILAGLFFLATGILFAYALLYVELKTNVRVAHRVDRGNMMLRAITESRLGLALIWGGMLWAISFCFAAPFQSWFYTPDKGSKQ